MRSESLIDFICETCKGYNYLNVCLVNLNHVQGFDSHLAIPQSGESSVTKKTPTAAPMRKRIGQQARKDEIVVREEFYLVIMYLFVCLLMYIFF